jgi:hypothetical protein
MNGSKLSRIFAPAVTSVFLVAWLAWPAYVASRPGRKTRYVPRHARPAAVPARERLT